MITQGLIKLATKVLIALIRPWKNGDHLEGVRYKGIQWMVQIKDIEADQRRISEILAKLPEDC